MWKTAFKKPFLKAVFHKFYLFHSWIPWSIYIYSCSNLSSFNKSYIHMLCWVFNSFAFTKQNRVCYDQVLKYLKMIPWLAIHKCRIELWVLYYVHLKWVLHLFGKGDIFFKKSNDTYFEKIFWYNLLIPFINGSWIISIREDHSIWKSNRIQKSTTNENPGACLVTYSLTNLQVLLFSVIIQVTFVPPIFSEIFHFIVYNFNPSYGLTWGFNKTL